MKTVYTCFCTDVIHDGHLNIINHMKKYGRVIVGCLSDKEMIRCTKFPITSEQERMALYQDLDGVDQVVLQDDMLSVWENPTFLPSRTLPEAPSAALPPLLSSPAEPPACSACVSGFAAAGSWVDPPQAVSDRAIKADIATVINRFIIRFLLNGKPEQYLLHG